MAQFDNDDDTNFNSFWAETERRERESLNDEDLVDEDFEEPAIDIHDDLEADDEEIATGEVVGNQEMADEFESNPEDFDDIDAEDQSTWPEEFREEPMNETDRAAMVAEHDAIIAEIEAEETVTLALPEEMRGMTARQAAMGNITNDQLAQAVQMAGFPAEVAAGVVRLAEQAGDGFILPETITMRVAPEIEEPTAPAELPEGISEEPPAEAPPASTPEEDQAAIARLERWIAGEVEPPTAEQVQFYNLTRDLQENTMIFSLKVKGITFRQRVKDHEDIYTEDVKEAAEAEMVTSTKKLLDCPELRAIKNCKKKFVKWLKFRLLDCSILKGGMFLIPHRNVTRVQQEYEIFRRARYNAVLELVRVYDQRVEENMAKINKKKVLVKRSDYPTIKQVVDAFTVSKEWIPFSAPEALKAISESIWQEEMAGIQIKVASVAQDSLSKLQEGLQHYVNWLVDTLANTQANGKKRAIAADKMADMRTFLAEIRNLNITNNAELDALAERATRAIEGIEVGQLKSSETTRASVLAQFQGLQEVTNTWIINVENQHLVVEEDDV